MALRFFRPLAVSFAIVVTLTVFTSRAHAVDVPQTFTLDGQLYNDAAATAPLLDSSILMKIQILDEDRVCVLYEESQTVNTVFSKGYFTVQVGSATGDAKRGGSDTANGMSTVFQNINNVNGKKLADGTPCAVTAGGGKRRFVRIAISPSTMGSTARTLSPDLTIDSVPNAIVAERAESLQGYRSADMLKVNTASGTALSQSNLESLFTSSTRFNALSSVVDGTSTNYMRTTAAGAQLPVFTGSPTSPTQGSLWFDTSDQKMKYRTGTGTTEILGTSSGTLTSLTGDVSASGSGAVTATVNTVGTSTAANVHAAEVLANAATDANTGSMIVKRDASGNFAAGSITGKGFVFLDSTTKTVGLVAPTTVATNYVLKLPNAAPSVSGQVLSSDTAGNMSWFTAMSPSLNSGLIFVGNALNVAAAVTPSQDVGVSNTGVFTVTGIRGRAVSATAPTDGQVLKYVNGTTSWTPASFGAGDLQTSTGVSQFASASCAANQTLTWTSLTNTFTCTNIAGLDAGVITTGTIADARLPASATSWTVAGSDVYRASGKVGIGTSSPGAALEVAGADAVINGARIGIGPGALTTNTLVGYQSMLANTTGGYNTVLGFEAFTANTTNSYNTAIGQGALKVNNATQPSLAVGSGALYSNTNGDRNTAVGTYSMLNSTSGSNNAAFGHRAFQGSTTGSQNTSIGSKSMQAASGAATDNTTVGYQGLNSLTTGNGNIAIGSNGGGNITTGNNNIVIGTGANVTTATADNQLNIGNTIFGDTSAANVGIGVTTPTARLHLPASTATAGSAPLKITTGALMTTPEAGAIEYDGTSLYYTDSTNARKTISTGGGGTFTNVSSVANSSGNITLSPQATSGAVIVDSGAASSSSTTGALRVTGGVGVSGSLFAGTAVTAPSINATTSLLTPQIYGSSAASGTIKIDGTSATTKGSVLLNSAGGKVGIGTTAPAGALEVANSYSGTSSGAELIATNLYNGSRVSDLTFRLTDSVGTIKPVAMIQALSNNSDSSNGANLLFYTRTADATPTEKMRLDNEGNLSVAQVGHFGGSTAPPVSQGQGAYIGWNAMTTFSGETDIINHRGGGPGGIAFMDAGNLSTPWMFINGSGKVGIGTSAPATTLDVENTSGCCDYTATFGNTTSISGVTINSNGATPAYLSLNSVGNSTWTLGDMGGNTSLYFIPSGNINGTPNVVFTAGGSVGIGTTTPGGFFDVQGGTAASGNGLGIILKGQNGKQTGDTNGGAIAITGGDGHYAGGGGSPGGQVSITGGITPGDTSNGTGASVVVTGASWGRGAGNATITGGDGKVGNVGGDVTLQGGTGGTTGKVLLAPTGGRVGIGTTSPSETLHVVGNLRVQGQAYSTSQSSTTTTPLLFDANLGNVMSWDAAAQTNLSVNVNNLKDGGSYTLAIRGTATGSTVINCYSDAGSTLLTNSYMPANADRATSASLYTILRVGNYCYISWSTGWP